MKSDGIYYLWDRRDPVEPLSRHFSTKEFTCHCLFASCRTQRVAIDLIKRLEDVRAAAGEPITVDSGYRCQAYQNQLMKDPNVETVTNSQHVLGRAADIKLSNANSSLFTFTQLIAECEKQFRAIGEGIHFIHVDLRIDKVRHWFYSY